MSENNQNSARRPRQAVTKPGNDIRMPRSSMGQTLQDAQSAQNPQSNQSPRVAHNPQTTQTPTQSPKRPVSFSRHPIGQSMPRSTPQPQPKSQPVKQQKPKKPLNLRWLGAPFRFIARHYKGLGITALWGATAMYWIAADDKNDDKRARLDNEPLKTLVANPTQTTTGQTSNIGPAPSREQAAIEAARNLVPSPSKQMVNGRNTAFDSPHWEKGAIAVVTGDSNNDPLAPDAGRINRSYLTEGTYSATTGANLGGTLIPNEGGDLWKGTPAEKPKNEDQARLLYNVDNYNDGVNLGQEVPSSQTPARLAPSKYKEKNVKSVTPARKAVDPQAARQAAAKRAAAQKAAMVNKNRGK